MAKEALNRLEKDIFPLIGKRLISEIDAPLMLDVPRSVEQRGAQEVVARLGQLCSQIFRYSTASGLAKYPITSYSLRKRRLMMGFMWALVPEPKLL